MLGDRKRAELSLKQSEYIEKIRIIAEINEITNRKSVEKNQWTKS